MYTYTHCKLYNYLQGNHKSDKSGMENIIEQALKSSRISLPVCEILLKKQERLTNTPLNRQILKNCKTKGKKTKQNHKNN